VIALLLAAGWLFALAALASGHVWAQLAAGALAVAAPVFLLRGPRGLCIGLAAVGMLGLAWMRWQAATAPPAADSLLWWADGSRTAVTGRVVEPPETRGSTRRLVVEARAIVHGRPTT
jgi:hypothetical protein